MCLHDSACRLVQDEDTGSDEHSSVVALGDLQGQTLKHALSSRAQYNVPAQRFGLPVGERWCLLPSCEWPWILHIHHLGCIPDSFGRQAHSYMH